MILYEIEEKPALSPEKNDQRINEIKTPINAYPPGSPRLFKENLIKINDKTVTINNNSA
jgi:hypothetical protein